MARALLFRVLDAVDTEGFPAELRHLAIRYAYAANSQTGKAWYGQAHMAAVLGIKERQLRRRLARLDDLVAKGLSPIRIERRRRGKPGGTGRSSDEWRIVVLSDKPNRSHATGSDGNRSGQPRPVELEAEAVIPGDPKRSSVAPEPVIGDRGSSGVIQRSDPAEDLRDASRANGAPDFKLEPQHKAARRRTKKPERTRTDAEVTAHRAVLDAFVTGVQHRTGTAPTIGSREAAAAWKLVDWAKGDEARAVAIVTEATSREFGGSTSIIAIAADPNKYLGKRKGAGRPPQPNSGWQPPTADTAKGEF